MRCQSWVVEVVGTRLKKPRTVIKVVLAGHVHDGEGNLRPTLLDEARQALRHNAHWLRPSRLWDVGEEPRLCLGALQVAVDYDEDDGLEVLVRCSRCWSTTEMPGLPTGDNLETWLAQAVAYTMPG